MFKFFKSKDNKEQSQKPQQEPLIENKDFYIENGYYVFTEYYLKKRGYCCGSGCRHCPYGDEKI